jgi:hypothetical protein
LAEFSVLIVSIQFFGIDFFTMLNSAIQLYITFENKSIGFENWIKSDLIYINDILDSTKDKV